MNKLNTIGADGLTATGSVSLLEAINNAFGLYFLSCVSSRISYLFGQKRNEECAQVFVDIIRISWICSVILPILMLNISKPLTRWFGAQICALNSICSKFWYKLIKKRIFVRNTGRSQLSLF